MMHSKELLSQIEEKTKEDKIVILSGRKITIEQRPFIEADICAARKVLTKLAASRKVSSYWEVGVNYKVITTKVCNIDE